METYKATYDVADDWLKEAMKFAITSLQRRDDLVNTRKKEDFDGDRMLVMQRKTGKRIAIKIGGSLAEVVECSKKSYPFCPFIIARKPESDRRGKKAHPYQVTAEFLTKAVMAARDASGAFEGWLPEELPTLHEFRSFGAYLYQEAGNPDSYIQALLGHADAKMTQHYLDGHREPEWEEISADLKLHSSFVSDGYPMVGTRYQRKARNW